MVISTSRYLIFQLSNSHELIRGSIAGRIMFVTNWLTWNTGMMQANCSTPSRGVSGLDFNSFLFCLTIQHQQAAALWAVSQQTKLEKRRARFNQLWTGESSDPSRPAGLSIHAPLSTCHVTSNHLVLAWEVQCRGKVSSHWPLCGFGHMSLPVGLRGLESGNNFDTHTACIKPSFCLRISRVRMSHDVPAGWE